MSGAWSTSGGRVAAGIAGAVAAVAVALLSGCTGPGVPGSTGAADTPSPLEPYYSVLYGSGSPEAAREREASIQSAVAACMKEQGFDYKPFLDAGTMVSTDEMAIPWGSEEFAKTYGYGVSTDTSAAFGGSTPPPDPNQEYRESLSESEQTAYDEALYGPPMAPDTSFDEWDWTKGGCMGAAQHDLGGDAAADDPEFSSLVEQMNGLYQTTADEPEVVDAEKVWGACMAEAGYGEFEQHDEPQQRFSERLSGMLGSDGSQEPDEGELEALRAEEIATATADWHCSEESGYTETRDRVERRLEQEFVDAHKEELDALVARYGTE